MKQALIVSGQSRRVSIVRTVIGVTLLAMGKYFLQDRPQPAPVPMMLEPQRRRRTLNPGYSWARDPIRNEE